MSAPHLPFNRPFAVGRELEYIRQAIEGAHLSGDGPFTRRCQAWLEARVGSARALLTHSCTAALEMMAFLAEVEPGDEIIMPSFTFVSTANAFVLRGGVPVFVDVRPDTLNLDEKKIEDAITPRTRAIVVVHYAGVACEMNTIMALARHRKLWLFEDAAQGLMATYDDRPLGSFGHLAAVSFHETKNVIAGEGGALLVNMAELAQRAEIVREKGTNRSQFFRREVDKYTWVDVGSSYLPSEINAAFLAAQLEEADSITERRRAVWQAYHERLGPLERRGVLRRPTVPSNCGHNAHLYYILAKDRAARARILETLARHGVNAVFHYVPLHSSPAGRRHGRPHGDLSLTEELSERLVRLPLWVGMTDAHVDRVVQVVRESIGA